MVEEGYRQWYQVELWLRDASLLGGGGLVGLGWLTQEQLGRCREARLKAVRESFGPSDFQHDVFRQLKGLEGSLAGLSVKGMEVLDQVDGVFLIDIVAEYQGQLLAIEVDGPTHFLAPDQHVTSDTLYRKRALQARGYRVLGVPYFEWGRLRGADAKQQWLKQQLARAI